ncbi:MAG: EF-P lysine aminoacylase GenX, partial [Alphaproteobacteria bacterium]
MQEKSAFEMTSIGKEKEKWWRPAVFAEKIPHLEKRARLISAIRQFFTLRGYLEVETSALQNSPGMEVHVKAFETRLYDVDRERFTEKRLHTSPEIAMKKLLVAGLPKIFQICQVYRNAEGSSLHSPVFTMLEWYQTGLSYRGLMEETVEMIRAVADQAIRWGDKISDPFADWQFISVKDAFVQYAGIDLDAVLDDDDGFAAAAAQAGCPAHDGDTWDDIFFRIFLEKIEPCLGHPAPTILYDYPTGMAALSRKKSEDPRYAERFEVYICGMELANAFGELTDAAEQKSR